MHKPIRCEQVVKAYGSVLALRGVTFEISENEIVALLGPNGSGKSTLLSILLGLLTQDGGRVSIFGLSPKAINARMRRGAMLQSADAPSTLKVRELVDLVSSRYENPIPTTEALEAADMLDHADSWYGRLSGGQKRRVQFAMAICGNPDILILDEPTVGMDPEYRTHFWEMLSVWGRGRTVLFATHYLEEADRYADRVIILHDGRVRADGPVDEIKARVAGKRIRFRGPCEEAQLRDLPGLADLTVRGEVCELVVSDAEAVLPLLLQRVPSLRDLEVTGTELEDVFHELVRGDGEDAAPGRD